MVISSPIVALTLMLSLSVLSVLFFQKLKLPSILGYLLVGIILGKSGLHLFYLNDHLQLLAEFGIVFMLFTIGLEMSFNKLFNERKNILFIGGIQVLIGTIIPAITACLLGMGLSGAVIAAAAVTFSSTAIITKLLSDRKELNTSYGRIAFSILLFQDIAAIPFLIIIPSLGAHAQNQQIIQVLSLTLIKGTVALILMIAIGKKILPVIYNSIAKMRSAELLTLTSLMVILITALLTYSMGLSFALGAFLAGVALGESEHLPYIEKDIRPFKDVLLGFFFITVGAQLDIFSVSTNWYWVILLLLMITLFKMISITFIARFFGRFTLETALRTGIILAHAGEFGFALLSLSLQFDVLRNDYAQVILAGIILSMCLSPFMVLYNNQISKYLMDHV